MPLYSLPTITTVTFFFLLMATADDSAPMLWLAKALIPLPSGWSTTSSTGYCNWKGVKCDNSGRVSSISLSSMKLSGSLPDLSSLSELTTLSLQSNLISGPIPNLSKLGSLQDVFLDNNAFTSVPDGCFDGLSSLRTLSLSQNANLSAWVFPEELAKSSSDLNTLYLNNANVVGTIPDVFDSFPSLQDVRLSYNNLTGSLPASFGNSAIQNLWIDNQKSGLSGTLDVLSKMSQLKQVWVHNNKFTGPIPDMRDSASLFDMSLRDNQLTGVIPESVIQLPALVNILLKNNKLQGPYPSFPKNVEKVDVENNDFCLDSSQAGEPCDAQVTIMLQIAGAMGYPVVLADSWPGNNACSDWSFITCDTQGRITSVNLANKKLSGTISPAYGNLTALKRLYLQQNNLTGKIPDSLTKIATLDNLDVSNNFLSGKVPTFGNRVRLAISPGNSFSGVDIDVSSNNAALGSTHGTTGSGKRKPLSVVFATFIFVAVLLYMVYIIVVKWRRGKFGRIMNLESENSLSQNAMVRGIYPNAYGVSSGMNSQRSGVNIAIPIDVLRQVTCNFNEANILGRGGFDTVYKGELHDGTKIAVKRMESNSVGSKGMSEFQAEIAVLTKVRHRHLVALLGYCINDNERLLVYEYIPQGTLAQRLFKCRELGFPPLTWKQRITIALDVARGVEYLHSLAHQSFIHRDLKPSNMLIGDDMRAKVADFRLVRNAPDGKHSVSTRVAGTFGYLAPEYAATGRVTTKVDVYSYGVVLMQIITCRKALDGSIPDEKAHLVAWFRSEGNVPSAIDETLNPDAETLDSINKVAELACHCTAQEPHQRPNMHYVVNVLCPLVKQWKPANHDDEEEEPPFDCDFHRSLSQALQTWQTSEFAYTIPCFYSH